MMKTKQITEFGNIYDCRYFYDYNTDCIDISLDGEHLGSIIGLSLPDEEDNEQVSYFEAEVINWIIDNGY